MDSISVIFPAKKRNTYIYIWKWKSRPYSQSVRSKMLLPRKSRQQNIFNRTISKFFIFVLICFSFPFSIHSFVRLFSQSVIWLIWNGYFCCCCCCCFLFLIYLHIRRISTCSMLLKIGTHFEMMWGFLASGSLYSVRSLPT